MIYGGKLLVTNQASGSYSVLLVSAGSADPLCQGTSSASIIEGSYIAPTAAAALMGLPEAVFVAM
jgi:hypothetical protein